MNSIRLNVVIASNHKSYHYWDTCIILHILIVSSSSRDLKVENLLLDHNMDIKLIGKQTTAQLQYSDSNTILTTFL